MKKRFIIMTILMCILLCSCEYLKQFAGSSNTTSGELKLYECHDIKLEIPKEWDFKDKSENSVNIYQCGLIGAEVGIFVIKNDGVRSREKIFSDFVNLAPMFPDTEYKEEFTITDHKLSVYRFAGTKTAKDKTFLCEGYIFIYRDKIYVIYFLDEDRNSKISAILEKVVRSISANPEYDDRAIKNCTIEEIDFELPSGWDYNSDEDFYKHYYSALRIYTFSAEEKLSKKDLTQLTKDAFNGELADKIEEIKLDCGLAAYLYDGALADSPGYFVRAVFFQHKKTIYVFSHIEADINKGLERGEFDQIIKSISAKGLKKSKELDIETPTPTPEDDPEPTKELDSTPTQSPTPTPTPTVTPTPTPTVSPTPTPTPTVTPTPTPTVSPTPTPKPTATPKPTPTSKPKNNGGSSLLVYVSKNNVMHLNPSCSGMKYYTTMSYDSAVRSGARACSKCF